MNELEILNGKIEKLKEENSMLHEEIAMKTQIIKDTSNEATYLKNQLNDCKKKNESLYQQREELEHKISELEFEILTKGSVVEVPIASGPMSVAEQLISATYTRKKGNIEKSICVAIGDDSDTAIEKAYTISELKQIAEHLLVYCNHNSEEVKKE